METHDTGRLRKVLKVHIKSLFPSIWFQEPLDQVRPWHLSHKDFPGVAAVAASVRVHQLEREGKLTLTRIERG